MKFKYAVIGAGRQGTAALYDMAVNGNAEEIRIADIDKTQAIKASKKVNGLTNKELVRPFKLDVNNQEDLFTFLSGTDSFLSAVPYYYNLQIAKVAIKARSSMCDLGGNTDIVKEQLKLDDDAKHADISIIPDNGQVPGMGTSLCVYCMSLLDKPREVLMYDGGLPQNPKPPFNYLLTFNIEGLTNEYAEPTYFLREGKLVEVQPFGELEVVDFPPPIGKLEAFTTGGGTSTAPWTFEGLLQTYQNKTVRYPGHFSQLKAYWDLGLLDNNPIRVKDTYIVPRDVFHSLFEPMVTNPEEKDLVVIRIKCKGIKDGKEQEVILDLVDFYDDTTGFTAMQRTTGWDASIVAIMMANGKTKKGAYPVELAIDGDLFVKELQKRGFNIKISLKEL